MAPNPTITLSPPTLGTNSQTFKDAMIVRTEVFVHEQSVPAENELDSDDSRSFHLVAYATSEIDGKEETIPVGTIRIVPAPHAPHEGVIDGNYIKFGRMATLNAFRGLGVGRLLVEAAVEFVERNPGSVRPRHGEGRELKGEWDGRCLAHAQSGVKKWWAARGFVEDEKMGEWDEEGIMHVGMWRICGSRDA
ncbi:hypothetical protein RUND412_010659 [Rhizina undulata]